MGLRVLHIGKFFPPARGGMEVYLAELIEAQRAQGIEACALVHGQPQAGDPDWLTRVPVQAHLAYAPLALGFRAALSRAIRRYDPDVLHLHLPNNSVFWALTIASARSLPWLVHWHSDVVFTGNRILTLAYRLYQPFEHAVLARSERIAVTSPAYLASSEPLAAWREKCVVVPLGVALPAGQEQGEDVVLPWREGRLRLLSIGRLAHYKGFETLVRAVAGLPDVELVIAGDGELRAALQALVDETTPAGQTPAVTLVGNVSEARKHALLSGCDLFCMASRERTEAFGLVLLEAMLHARPCLVSDLKGSGMPWVVQQAGCGDVVPVDDVPAWRAAITRWAADPAARRTCGERGQRALHERFTVQASARLLTPHYAALAGEAQRPRADDILIVIPAYNEARTIGPLIAALQRAGRTEVLVVDDSSTDGTRSIAEAAGARVLCPVLRMGAWGAMQAGIRYAQAQGYQAVVTMDADGQHEVDEIPQLLRAAGQADLVIGAFAQRASPARRIAWRWFTHLTGLDLEDLTSGFRYYDKAAMRVLACDEATLLDYQDVGTLLMLRRAGLRILEVPVEMKLRVADRSRIFNSWFSVARYMAVTTLLCLSQWRGGRERAQGPG